MSYEIQADIIFGLIPRCKGCRKYITFKQYYEWEGYCDNCFWICTDFPLVDEDEGCCEWCFAKCDDLEEIIDEDGKWVKICESCRIDGQMYAMEGV